MWSPSPVASSGLEGKKLELAWWVLESHNEVQFSIQNTKKMIKTFQNQKRPKKTKKRRRYCGCFVQVAIITIDYRCEDRQEVDELRGDIGDVIRYILTPTFRKSRSLPSKKKKNTKNRAIQQGDALTIQYLSLGIKLSNSKRGC